MIEIFVKDKLPEIKIKKTTKMGAPEWASVILLLSNGSFGIKLAEVLKETLSPEDYLEIEDLCMEIMQNSKGNRDKVRLAAAGVSMAEMLQNMGESTDE